MLDGGLPVRVRFALVTQEVKEATPYYEGLFEHLQASRLVDTAAISNGLMRLLVAEDFNISGLTGTTKREEITEESASNYYNFWWREGIAQKRGIHSRCSQSLFLR